MLTWGFYNNVYIFPGRYQPLIIELFYVFHNVNYLYTNVQSIRSEPVKPQMMNGRQTL